MSVRRGSRRSGGPHRSGRRRTRRLSRSRRQRQPRGSPPRRAASGNRGCPGRCRRRGPAGRRRGPRARSPQYGRVRSRIEVVDRRSQSSMETTPSRSRRFSPHHSYRGGSPRSTTPSRTSDATCTSSFVSPAASPLPPRRPTFVMVGTPCSAATSRSRSGSQQP